MGAHIKSSDYESEPVVYCARCYSLKIKYEESIDTDCCMDCGSTDIMTSSIEDWEGKYEKRYGKAYVQKSYDPRTSYIYSLSPGELKMMLYASPTWKEDIRTLYRNFPKGLTKEESVILVFDKLTKDRRLDDLKYLLYKQQKTRNNGREEVRKDS